MNLHWCLQSTICVMIEFLLIFGETNFVEVEMEVHKIHENLQNL